MISGKYSALAGAISREQAIANVSNNLANISTSGYKKSRVSFESILNGEKQTKDTKGINYNRVRQNFTDFSPGALRETENPLDLAIQGDGFLKVQGEDKILYTRRGDLTIDSTGNLATNNGNAVLDENNAQITIPDTDTNKIALADDGTIYLLDSQGGRAVVAKIALVDIEDKTQLKRESDTAFSLDDPTQEIPVENARVVQGNLELSNVNMSAEMTKMIDNYRVFETYHKVLKSYSTIGEHQKELGTLG